MKDVSEVVNTPTKIDGLSDAVSYLSSLDFVDTDKLYGLGACAGTSTMAYFALADKRIKKVVFVSAMLANETIPGYAHIGPEFFLEAFSRYNAHQIAGYITQPTLTIYGNKAITRVFSWLFHFKKRGAKKMVSIKGARHVCLYDNDEYVSQAVSAINKYFK